MPLHPRAAQLIDTLGLVPHPEGGHFGEVYRAAERVQPADGRSERAAMTTIFFLLAAGEVSRWHRVGSDEVWHFYEGEPLELLAADTAFADVRCELLGPVERAARPVHVVRAGEWQAARSTGVYTLVGCTVAPGFEYADFELIDPASERAAELARRRPDLARFI